MSDTFAPRLGRRALRISGELLLSLFQAGEHQGYRVIRDAIPVDARLIDARWDALADVVTLRIVSAEFASDHITDNDEDITPILATLESGDAHV